MGASSFDPAPRGRTVSRTRGHAPELRKRYVGGEAGTARPMAQSPADAHWTRRAAGLFGGGDEVEGGGAGRGRAPAPARRARVAPRQERAARAHLGRVRDRAPLELALAEEAVEEDAEGGLDRPDRVLLAPRAPGEEGHLGRRGAER